MYINYYNMSLEEDSLVFESEVVVDAANIYKIIK